MNGPDATFTTYGTPPPSGCANEQRREEQAATMLPDCRAYEMVSPLDKKGSEVLVQDKWVEAASDGERVSYATLSGFGETTGSDPYGFVQQLATRDADGWRSRGITPTPVRDPGAVFGGGMDGSCFRPI